MLSATHEALVRLFRNRPELAPELLRGALGVTLPAYAQARVESAELTDVAPAEYRADLVVLLVDSKPVLAIVIEVQLQRDDRKRFTWPVYVAGIRARFECPACVLVVTPNDAVATWARMPVDLGPGSRFEPLVVGPSAVPVVRDVGQAVADPELAVLSAMAHGDDAPEIAVSIAFAALEASRTLDDERALLYSDLIFASLGEAARVAFEELMVRNDYEYQSDFAKKHQAVGRAEGKAEGEASALLTLLDARGIAMSPDDRDRILACNDVAVLERWIRRAVAIAIIDELFAV